MARSRSRTFTKNTGTKPAFTKPSSPHQLCHHQLCPAPSQSPLCPSLAPAPPPPSRWKSNQAPVCLSCLISQQVMKYCSHLTFLQ